MNKQQLQQEIEALQNQLEEKQKALAAMPDKWEPKNGGYLVDFNGEVVRAPSSDETRVFGTEYTSRQQAEKAAKAMRAHNRLLAYVAEFAPDFSYKFDDVKWFVSYDTDTLTWFADFCTDFVVGVAFMPESVARELAAKLNSGEVEL